MLNVKYNANDIVYMRENRANLSVCAATNFSNTHVWLDENKITYFEFSQSDNWSN